MIIDTQEYLNLKNYIAALEEKVDSQKETITDLTNKLSSAGVKMVDLQKKEQDFEKEKGMYLNFFSGLIKEKNELVEENRKLRRTKVMQANKINSLEAMLYDKQKTVR